MTSSCYVATKSFDWPKASADEKCSSRKFLVCSQDYHWWWRSFLTSSSCSIYVFAYAIFYYVQKVRVVFVATAFYYVQKVRIHVCTAFYYVQKVRVHVRTAWSWSTIARQCHWNVGEVWYICEEMCTLCALQNVRLHGITSNEKTQLLIYISFCV